MSRAVLLGRACFAAVGVAALGYGAWLVWRMGSEQWLPLVKWLAGGVIAHDLLLAPVVVVIGILAARALPAYARLPVALAVVVWGSITVLAIPVLGQFGATPSLPSLLNRPYRPAWWIGTGVVVSAVVVSSLIRRVGAPKAE